MIRRPHQMYVDRLDRKISVSFHERKAGESRAKQDRISDERRRLLELVVSNSSWKDGRLPFSLHVPLALILIEAGKAREADAADAATGS